MSSVKRKPMLGQANDQAQESNQLQGRGSNQKERYYDNLLKRKFIFNTHVVMINGTDYPPALARLMLKGWYKVTGWEFVPVGGNYVTGPQAKVLSWIFGTGKDIFRRVKEQERTDLGSQIWFTRQVVSGDFLHWAFIIDDVKYELRRAPEKSDALPEEVHTSPAYEGQKAYPRYHFRSTPVSLDLQARDGRIEQTGFPMDDTFYICLIGWTQKSRDEIDTIGNELMKNFGKYNKLWNNCQRFLRKLFKAIHNTKAPRAADYSWFKTHMKTKYQHKKTLMEKSPPDAMHKVGELKAQELSHNSSHNDQGLNNVLGTVDIVNAQSALASQNWMMPPQPAV